MASWPTSQETPIGVGVNNTLPLFNSRNLPNMVPGVDPKLDTSNFDPARDLYLNIKAFQTPAPFTFGNAPSLLNVRAFPSYNEDFGIMKRTYIREQMNIEFRFEMFNAFNRHIFGGSCRPISTTCPLLARLFQRVEEEGGSLP